MEKQVPAKGLSIAALVLGICSVVFCWVSAVGYVFVALGIAAIIMGAIASKKAKAAGVKNKIATAALVLGIIGTILSLVLFIACVACAAAANQVANDPALQSELADALSSALETVG